MITPSNEIKYMKIATQLHNLEALMTQVEEHYNQHLLYLPNHLSAYGKSQNQQM